MNTKPENPQAMTPPSPSADFATPVDRSRPNGSRQTSPPSPQLQLQLPQFQDSPRAARFAARSPTTTPRTAAGNEARLRIAQLDAMSMIKESIVDIVLNEPAIADAVNGLATRSTLYADGADLCRMVVERVDTKNTKRFTIPQLTDAQVKQLRTKLISFSGGSKKKRRTGKNTKSKTRTRNNSRTIKKMKIRRIRKIIK